MADHEIFENLPESSEQAFVFLESYYRRKLDEALVGDPETSSCSYNRIDYISDILGSARSLELEILQDWALPRSYEHAQEMFEAFSAEVRFHVADFKIRGAHHRKQYSVRLDQSDKEKVRFYINKIRKIVDASSLNDDKKDKLYNILDSLSNEISRDRTRFEAVMDRMRIMADLTEEIEPKLLSPIVRILRLIHHAKEKEDETRSLPGPREKRRLEPPRNDELPASTRKTQTKEVDDEIPF